MWELDFKHNDPVPCYGVNNLVPLSGNSLNCIFRHPNIVLIKNFKGIAPNSRIRILISGITNPSTPTFTVTLKIWEKNNRIATLLNTGTATGSLNPTGTTQPCLNSPTYTDQRVGYKFMMRVQPCLGTLIAGAQVLMFLPKYDVGFVHSDITC